MPNAKNISTMFFESILPELRKKSKVHVIWFVYQPEKQNLLIPQNSDTTISFIHDYKNAVEVLKNEKPDLIYSGATWSFIDYALSLAAKFLNIPVCSMLWSDWYFDSSTNLINRIKLLLTRFFESSIPTDTVQNQKQFMRRGRFYIYKLLFMLKTQRAINMSRSEILKLLFVIIKQILTDAPNNSRFANTIHFLEDEHLQNQLLKAGFKKSSLVVTGNPLFDSPFQKLHSKIPSHKKNDDTIIHVLFAPTTLYEHGMWTKSQKDFAIKQIISKLAENKKEMSVVVKIHPSSSLLSEYQPIINSVDSSISVYKNGDIQQFLDTADIMISFQSATTEIYAMIAKKPIVICNFFSSKTDKFVENGVAFECKNPSDLVKIIHHAISNQSYEHNREKFIQEFMYKGDGRAAERISNEIMNLLQKNHNTL